MARATREGSKGYGSFMLFRCGRKVRPAHRIASLRREGGRIVFTKQGNGGRQCWKRSGRRGTHPFPTPDEGGRGNGTQLPPCKHPLFTEDSGSLCAKGVRSTTFSPQGGGQVFSFSLTWKRGSGVPRGRHGSRHLKAESASRLRKDEKTIGRKSINTGNVGTTTAGCPSS